MNESRYYKTNNGIFYSVQHDDNFIAQMEVDDLVEQGLYIHGDDKIGDDLSWVDDLNAKEKRAIIDAYDEMLWDEAVDAFHYDEESDEENPTVDELIEFGYIDDIEDLVLKMTFGEMDEVINSLTSVYAFEISGYSQGDIDIIILNKELSEMYGNKENAQKHLQTIVFDGYLSVDECDEELTTFENMENINAMDYSTDEEYSQTLDDFMLKNYKAKPAQLETTYKIV